MPDNNIQDEKFTDDNNKKSVSSEDNGVQDLSKINSDEKNEQYKELPLPESNKSQDLSKTNLSRNNPQINPDQEKVEDDNNNKKSVSSEDNGVQDLSKINSDQSNEQYKELPLPENNKSQDLSKTNLSGNNPQINPEQKKVEDDANCVTLSKVFELITELQKSLTAQTSQIKNIQDKQELIINKINELSNDVKNPLPNIQQKTVRTKSKSNKYEPPFIPVSCLEEHGKDELHKKLETMTVDELKQMNKHFLSKPKKELDKIDREQMIQYLIKYAETELNRGGKFLKDR